MLIVAVTSGAAIRSYIRSEARSKREAGYQSSLQRYSQNLKPGLSRQEVEKYIRAHGDSFIQMCCIVNPSAPADLIGVGKEEAPWYCSETHVSIAFEFAAVEAHYPLNAGDSDVLKEVRLFYQLGGCL